MGQLNYKNLFSNLTSHCSPLNLFTVSSEACPLVGRFTPPTSLGLKQNLRILHPLGSYLRKVAHSPHPPEPQGIVFAKAVGHHSLLPLDKYRRSVEFDVTILYHLASSHVYHTAVFFHFLKCTESDQAHNLPIHSLVSSVSMRTARPAPSLPLP